MNKVLFEDRYSLYFRENIRYVLLHKYCLQNFEMLSIEKVDVVYKGSVLNDDNVLIMQSLSLLETITGKKSIIKGSYKYIGPVKKFFFTSKVSLRKENFLLFFNYLSTCCLPIYVKRNGIEIEKKDLNIKIKDKHFKQVI